MNAQVTTAVVALPAAWSRLRLKVVFLRTLVISLTTCALVAVAALLWGTFTQTTGKVLATLGALAFHSGLAMVCAETLERRRWPRLSAVGLVAFGTNFCVLIACIWWPGYFDDTTGRATVATVTLVAFYILAVPSADSCERRIQPTLSSLGLLVCSVAYGMCLMCIWGPYTELKDFSKATAIACIIAFSLAHTALLIRVPGQRTVARLLEASLVCVWLLAAMASASVIWEIQAEYWYRWLGAVGVLDACGSLALLIMAKLRQVGKIEKLRTTATQIELRCPRCTVPQTVDVGAARCSSCGLKFRIEIEEPRCAQCDYLLWQLPERRCPECGTTF